VEAKKADDASDDTSQSKTAIAQRKIDLKPLVVR